MIRIQYEITENAQVLSCDFKSSKVNQCWLLSWDISGHEGLKCDRNTQNDGAIPIGTIATPVNLDKHQIVELLELDKLFSYFILNPYHFNRQVELLVRIILCGRSHHVFQNIPIICYVFWRK
jgi:hypothetical protein